VTQKKVLFLRYPGGKSRMLDFLIPQFASSILTANRFVEPFAGGGAVFFAVPHLCPREDRTWSEGHSGGPCFNPRRS